MKLCWGCLTAKKTEGLSLKKVSELGSGEGFDWKIESQMIHIVGSLYIAKRLICFVAQQKMAEYL